MKDVAIFIPSRNVANTLTKVLDRIPDDIKNQVGEIFIIDNDSKDRTYLIGVEYKEKNQMHNLKVYKNEKNLGYGGSQKKAYQYAIDKGFKIIIMLHGDAQYPPENLKNLLIPLMNEEADLVFGSRMSSDPLGGGMPLWRFIGNKLLTKIENRVLGINLSEYHSGFRGFKVSSLEKLPIKLLSNDYHFDTEIIIQLVQAKMKIIEVPIPTHYGHDAKSLTIIQTLKYSINILIDMLKLTSHKSGIWKQKKFDVL